MNAQDGVKGFVAIPLALRMQNYEPVTESGCWVWLGETSSRGYGRIHVDGKKRQAHRIAWEMVNGAMPAHLDACHSCDVECCINPAHIWPGTPSENAKDAVRKGYVPSNPRWQAFKTHCKRGHEFTPENTAARLSNGKYIRRCRQCERDYRKARDALAKVTT